MLFDVCLVPASSSFVALATQQGKRYSAATAVAGHGLGPPQIYVFAALLTWMAELDTASSVDAANLRQWKEMTLQHRQEVVRVCKWPRARSTSHQNSLLRSVQNTLDVEARSSTCREPGAQVGRVAEGNGILVAEAPETSMSREALLVHRGFVMRADHGASELPNVNPLLVAAARAVKDPIRIRTMNWKLIMSSTRVAQRFGRSRE